MGDQHLQDQWDDIPDLLTTLLLDGLLSVPAGDRRAFAR